MGSICSGFMFRTRPNGTLVGLYGSSDVTIPIDLATLSEARSIGSSCVATVWRDYAPSTDTLWASAACVVALGPPVKGLLENCNPSFIDDFIQPFGA